MTKVNVSLHDICYGILLLSYAPPFLYAEVVVDRTAPKNNQPDLYYHIEEKKMCKMQNAYCQGGKYTVIDIQTPNSEGISHNKYVKFNAEKGKGYNKIIFNNIVASEKNGNSNLINGEAVVILNEVTSMSKSQLDSLLIVAGQSADIIIANPAGISCNGCRFRNTDYVTLTTGVPAFKGDKLAGFNVYQGNIYIGKEGLQHNEYMDNYLDLFSESLKVDGKIETTDLLSISGKNAISFKSDNKLWLRSLAGFSYNSKSEIGTDVSQLGGMYANKIFIVSKRSGSSNQGEIIADDIVSINSDFFISNVSGKIESHKIKLKSTGLIDNSKGRIKSERQGANYNQKEKFGVRIKGGLIKNHEGSIYANSGYVSMEAKNAFYNNNGDIRTLGSSGPADIKIKAKSMNNLNGSVISSDNIKVNANVFQNNHGRVISAFDQVDLHYKILSNKKGVIRGGLGVSKNIKP
ncbi:filamentous hemagglutinin N-terminal domain-containing protein [Yersinia sp. Marseille-Q3913]|uniref:two-partner secretion domain-containing protein n=1 Tax=Yersinia sp. Marseille-Q3913 TaxID=2830769 RepID=UPI001BB0443B|nr:filamentous hemagglutinin N-terminal domain-containing protein [Yersinia sp. Marseille-Q3913]MBS0056981.1 filamentous hemagglutinin N-terminal domain-containing protein [Yersinia sp. Marseille-Q3913]